MTSLTSFHKFVFSILLVSFSLSLVGCGGDDSKNKSGDQTNGQGGEGGQAGAQN